MDDGKGSKKAFLLPFLYAAFFGFSGAGLLYLFSASGILSAHFPIIQPFTHVDQCSLHLKSRFFSYFILFFPVLAYNQ